MYLLDAANDLQAIAAWGSFITAIITVYLTAHSIFTRKKIQELAEIVTKIENQNIILEKRLNIERLVTIMDRMPYLKLDHKDLENDGTLVRLHIHNIGIDGFDLQLFNYDNTTYKHDFETKTIEKGKFVKLVLTFKSKELVENITFDLSVKSIHGIEIRQHLHKLPGEDFILDPPIDII